MQQSENKKVGIYVHIPFCQVKCSYCHFFTFAGKLQYSPAYFRALKKELEGYREQLSDYEVNTVYIGGGTPSLVDAINITDLLRYIKANFNLTKDIEITIEANPESITEEKLDAYLDVGINRISIGVQAWQKRILKYLNRLYVIDTFLDKYSMVKIAGFNNVNLDLIFGIPHQTLGDWKESVINLIKLSPQHVSCYSLELDNNSLFGKLYSEGKFKAADPELDRQMYSFAIETMTKNGYQQYEISNFSKPGLESRHNLSFWLGLPYIGIGAAAHSYFNNERFHNIYSIEKYTSELLKGKNIREEMQKITKKKQMLEFMILRLRIMNGFTIDEFEEKFSTTPSEIYGERFQDLLDSKWIITDGKTLKLTRKGIDLYNQMVMKLMD